MDGPLDDRIAERQRGGRAPRRDGRSDVRRPRQRDSYRKLQSSRPLLDKRFEIDLDLTEGDKTQSRHHFTNLYKTSDDTRTPDDAHWVHDRFEGDRFTAPRRQPRLNRYDSEDDDLIPLEQSAKVRVDNLHYDLGEKDLRDLFTRKGPIESLELLYDRAGRSKGTAFVTYASVRDGERAVRDYDGANAYGQPIKLTLMPKGPSGSSGRGGSLASRVEGRSLIERAEVRRRRSESPRRTNVAKPPPEGVDRYVPGDRTRRRYSRSRSPARNARREPRGARGGRATGTRGGREPGRGARPKVTAEELDAEMNDYWGSASGAQTTQNGTATQGSENAPAAAAAPTATAGTADEDVDMIE